MAAPARTIASIALRLWLREVARLLAVPVSRVVVALAVLAACALALGALLAAVAATNLSDALPPELRSAVVATSFGGAALTAGAIGVALSVAAPPRTALHNLLALLPVGPIAARIGEMLPTLLLALGYTLAVSSTAIVVVVRTASQPLQLVLGLVAELALVATVLVVAVGIFSLVETAAERLARLPRAYATALGATVALGATLAATVPDVLLPPAPPGTDPGLAALLPHRAFAAAATAAPTVLPWLTPLAWVALGAAITVLAARVHRPARPPRRLVLPRGTRPVRASAGWGLLWLELLVLVRTPQPALVALATPVAVVGVAVVSALPYAAAVVPSLAGAVVLMPALLGLHVPGRTLPFDWIGDLLTGRPAARLLPQIAAVGLVAAVISAPALAAFLLLGLVEPSAVGGLLLRGLLALVLALACGAMVPWSEQQPLSASAGGLLLGIVSALLALGVSAAVSTLGAVAETPLVVLAALLAGGVFAGARRRAGARPGAA
jgi:hypothetical protein